MDNWQAWAAAIFSFMLATISFNNRRDKNRMDQNVEEFNEHKLEVIERVTRLEAAVVTEREVREILQEFLQPFLQSLYKIDSRTDGIAKDITEMKIQLASVPKRRGDSE